MQIDLRESRFDAVRYLGQALTPVTLMPAHAAECSRRTGDPLAHVAVWIDLQRHGQNIHLHHRGTQAHPAPRHHRDPDGRLRTARPMRVVPGPEGDHRLSPGGADRSSQFVDPLDDLPVDRHGHADGHTRARRRRHRRRCGVSQRFGEGTPVLTIARGDIAALVFVLGRDHLGHGAERRLRYGRAPRQRGVHLCHPTGHQRQPIRVEQYVVRLELPDDLPIVERPHRGGEQGALSEG